MRRKLYLTSPLLYKPEKQHRVKDQKCLLPRILFLMVFASIREHAEHCDFFASTSRDKKICFASSEQFREYNLRAVSTS